ncbi:hypothetical protein Pcinc_041951 [Petrolisthes cinctipes]|uniref:Reelin n=1 Tax=Petrolisthes cinctipes TaxID=88211 RepID=A0AAE1EJA9_PETCI|nr:hypothetical protein Pcinc_041951 [Petrolisthes cinctipes]
MRKENTQRDKIREIRETPERPERRGERAQGREIPERRCEKIRERHCEIRERRRDTVHSVCRAHSNISIPNPPVRTLTNATRFRLWQPRHSGTSRHTWAVDNLFIEGTEPTPNVLNDGFGESVPAKDAWVDWPGGYVQDKLCPNDESRSVLVFPSGEEGQHSLYTRDLTVDASSVIQFDEDEVPLAPRSLRAAGVATTVTVGRGQRVHRAIVFRPLWGRPWGLCERPCVCV